MSASVYEGGKDRMVNTLNIPERLRTKEEMASWEPEDRILYELSHAEEIQAAKERSFYGRGDNGWADRHDFGPED